MMFLNEYTSIDLTKNQKDVFEYICSIMGLKRTNLLVASIEDLAHMMKPKPMAISSVSKAVAILHRQGLIKKVVRARGRANGRYVVNPSIALKGSLELKAELVEMYDDNKWYDLTLR